MSSNFVESRMSANITEMERRRAAAALGGGQKRIDAQHAKGKLTARERLDVLLDEGSFEELDTYVEHDCVDFGLQDQRIPGDGVVTGSCTNHGRLRYLSKIGRASCGGHGGCACEAHGEHG